ncbi:MAG: lycopene beta-cyclase CrtY [Deltaproteobacteria bacterium]|nr:lycopene beta-cyclase CrtY [Deltaproteobacteria bacterium]
MNSHHTYDADVIVVGGGLAGGLCVLALTEHAPSLRVLLVEGNADLSGNHTWCCHKSDIEMVLETTAPSWFKRILSHQWTGYVVRFPNFDRQIDGEYFCITSERLRAALVANHAQNALDLALGDPATSVQKASVTLASGRALSAPLVIDARGMAGASFGTGTGFQKFLGWEIEVIDQPHPFGDCPLLMDASVEQADGYRFVYTLPFSSHRLLVEDTYFSQNPRLDEEHIRVRLRHYLSSHGVSDFRIIREERGVLPMPWRERERAKDHDAVTIGYRGGFFHPATGYSLGQAVAVAEHIGQASAGVQRDMIAPAVHNAVNTLRTELASDAAFARKLNFLAFVAARARGLRGLVFSRVYQMSESFLRRFYAARLTRRDRLALLARTARLPLFSSHEPQPLRRGEPA